MERRLALCLLTALWLTGHASAAPALPGMTGPGADVLEDSSPPLSPRPAGTSRGDYFTETYPEPTLTEQALLAVAAAPIWLADDLALAFEGLDPDDQDRYAGKILDADPPEWRDEIAFCVAHMLAPDITRGAFDDALLEENVQWIYGLDEHLEYVRLVEYGDPTMGGTDYYTTTAYVIDEGTGPFEVEVPREVYYWWLVHPRISDEKPQYTNPETGGVADQTAGGRFWRQYFWESDPTYDYRTNGAWECALLGDVAQLPTILWDREPVGLPSGREYTTDCHALDIVTNWVLDAVHWGATNPRPIQPVAIAYDHDGNCGEYQDILCAALRAALIPANATVTIVDDHVWCEFWDDGWKPIQDSDATSIGSYGVGADYTFGGWKDISAAWAWRGDYLNVDRTGSYSDHCTLTTTVVDGLGNPVDGALVQILGQSYYNPDYFSTCITVCTDTSGQVVLDLGDNRDFKADVRTGWGNHPVELIVEDTVAGEDYQHQVTLSGSMDVPQVVDLGEPPASRPAWRLTADVQVPLATRLDWKRGTAGLVEGARVPVNPGSVDCFLARKDQRELWEGNLPFDAHEVDRETSSYQRVLTMDQGLWSLVVSNRHHLRHREQVQVTLDLEQWEQGAWVPAETLTRSVSLNPGETYLASFGAAELELELDMPAQQFGEGDPCSLDLNLRNPGDEPLSADLYVLLGVMGEYFCYPGWAPLEEGLPSTPVTLAGGASDQMELLPSFVMPAVPPVGPLYFHAAAFDPGLLDLEHLAGNIDSFEFWLGD